MKKMSKKFVSDYQKGKVKGYENGKKLQNKKGTDRLFQIIIL